MRHPINPNEMGSAIKDIGNRMSRGDLDDLLQAVQEDIEDFWKEHMESVEDGSLELIAETDNELVFSDIDGQFWRAQFDALVEYINLLGSEDEGIPETVLAAHHNAAYRLADHNWSTSNPVVVSKQADFESAQRFVEATINGLISQDLSPGQAWAYYGVVIRGNSRNQWSQRGGYNDHSAVSQAVRAAKEKLSG